MYSERWYTLNQKSKAVWGHEREREIDTAMYQVARFERMERQRVHLQQFSRAPQRRGGRASRRILERYFLHQQPISDAEYGHVRRILDCL